MRPRADWGVSHFLSHSLAKTFCFLMNTRVVTNPTRGVDITFARDRMKPQDDASRSAALSFDGDAKNAAWVPATSYGHGVRQIVSRFLSGPQKRTPTGSQGVKAPPEKGKANIVPYSIRWTIRR